MLLARSNYKFFSHYQRGNCSRVSIAGLSPKPPFLRKGQFSQTYAAESREVKMSHRGAVAVGEFPVEFCKTKFRPRSWKGKNKDSRIPWESTMRWTLPVTQDTAPQTRLCDSLVMKRPSMLLSSPLFSFQWISVHLCPPCWVNTTALLV